MVGHRGKSPLALRMNKRGTRRCVAYTMVLQSDGDLIIQGLLSHVRIFWSVEQLPVTLRITEDVDVRSYA
jgi:hypothetical protein